MQKKLINFHQKKKAYNKGYIISYLTKKISLCKNKKSAVLGVL